MLLFVIRLGTRAAPREIDLDNSILPVESHHPRVSTPPRVITLSEHHFPSASDEPQMSPDNLRHRMPDFDQSSVGSVEDKLALRIAKPRKYTQDLLNTRYELKSRSYPRSIFGITFAGVCLFSNTLCNQISFFFLSPFLSAGRPHHQSVIHSHHPKRYSIFAVKCQSWTVAFSPSNTRICSDNNGTKWSIALV